MQALPLPSRAVNDNYLHGPYNKVVHFALSTDDHTPLHSTRANDATFNIYSILRLFYVMNELLCERKGLEKLKNSYIMDNYFEWDYFEYHTGITLVNVMNVTIKANITPSL
uniref:Uncharacterized protein n=1 Tax=Glossina palpalis gambiensis TaxID=67801 RepID=A0A1B0C216_9MUSC